MSQEFVIKEYTVSEIVTEIKKLIERNFYYIKIIGEVSDLKISSNGHSYFNLKDKNSLINAVMFKYTKNKYNPENGMLIKAFARLTTYQERSNYQIIIEAFEPNGEGGLLKIFEEKKKKLENLGLFNTDHKKSIPKIIKKIGIITSPTGAAIRDIEIRLQDRKSIKIFLYPAVVQGIDAENSIINGINYFNKTINKPDVIVITRGGGSLEDLMCFNGENLAYSIYNSELPIITAIGHEIDYTIADFVSDFRLPTPTSVAEFVSESKLILNNKIDQIFLNIRNNIKNRINKKIRKFNLIINKISYVLKNNKITSIENKSNKLISIFKKIANTLIKSYKNKKQLLNKFITKINKFNRKSILKNGYAMVEKNGKLINKNTKFYKDEILTINTINKKIIVKVIEIISN